MDSTLACCAGDPGLIPAVGKSKKLQYSDGFFLGIRWQVEKMEPDMRNWRDLASPYGKNNSNTSHAIYGADIV